MKEKIKALIEDLNKASEAYYEGNPIMSDHEWDRMFDELKSLEASSGIILPDSPTQNVSAGKVTGLVTRRHERPALSLDKIKYANKEDVKAFLGDREGMLSWKLDGSTVVITYDNGVMTSAVTRGTDGIEGNDITHNARFFKGLPGKIPYTGHLVLRGEALMSYVEFERINAEEGGMYENPRNLATATIQMLDANESRKREILFKAFKLVVPDVSEEVIELVNRSYEMQWEIERFEFLNDLGFDVVEHFLVSNDYKDGDYTEAANFNIMLKIEELKDKVKDLPYPTDGLVISYNDQIYAEELGFTGHHPRGAKALKWTDETEKTILRSIEWSVGKTGLVTPVAIFDPVRLGVGSTVIRASLHNISCLRSVPLRDGAHMDDYETMCLNDSVDVYLANMIIPQIASYGHDGDYTLKHSRTAIEIPRVCPVCGEPLRQEESNGVWTLHCDNEECAARQIGRLMNTFGKDGLFVKGLGESQLQDLIDVGLVTDTLSMYCLETTDAMNRQYSGFSPVDELLSRDGWGEKKWNNLLAAIEESKKTTLQKFLYSLNIPLLGNDLSKKLAPYFENEPKNILRMATYSCAYKDELIEELMSIDGVGKEKATFVAEWAQEVGTNERKYMELEYLMKLLQFENPTESTDASLSGLTFVITGAVNVYKNRDEFKESVEARGGKVAGSVSAKTSFLVNNDIESTSGKNAKAKELNIPIISEDEFISRFGK